MKSPKPLFKYDKAFLGGTFDRFHLGHQLLIDTAMHMANSVFIGIVSEALGEKLFAKKNHASMIQSYERRSGDVKNYISEFSNAEVGSLSDPWGPAPLENVENGVLVTSRETVKSGDIINKMRKDNKLGPLDVVVIPWVFDEDNVLYSSTRIRINEYQKRSKSLP